jgi:glycosyltransferase involved in cell wall biosynthesis/predicted O-methyltransferase YrrM
MNGINMNTKQRRAAKSARKHEASPPKPAGKSVGLCMIVKNESKVILRCLESVRPIVDYVLIEDTGSTDGTQAIIREWLDQVGLPGEVYDEPWRDFAYNRSHALAQLRGNKRVDYALVLDADDYIVFEPNFDVAAFKNSLSSDIYDAEERNGPIRYRRGHICSNRHAFRYRGVLHEFMDPPPDAITRGDATGFYIVSTREGARSQNPNKYRKDAEILKKALETEQDPSLRSRYTFYLARSYEHEEKEQALEYFLKRVELGGWADEVFLSHYSAAHIQKALGQPVEEVIATYLRASDAAPSRAEALHAASQLCRENRKFAQGYEYARRGLAIPQPNDGLFVVAWIYDYGLLDEFAVNAYWDERYQDCLDACQRLLGEGKMPLEMHDRVKKNAEFAAEKIRLQGVRSRPVAVISPLTEPRPKERKPMTDENSPLNTAAMFTNNWFEVTAKQIWDRLIPQINPTTILEIGSFEGASACYLIANCASKSPIEIHCIDTWEGVIEHKGAGVNMSDVERRFLDNTRIACDMVPHRVELITHKGLSNICLAKILSQSFLNYFDLIYIDGSHQAPDVLCDATLSFPLLKVGGTMIFDDYLWRAAPGDPVYSPKLAIDAFLNIYFHKMRIGWTPNNAQVFAKKIAE